MKEHSSEDLLRMKSISGVTLSGNGEHLAYISSNTYKEFKGIIENRLYLKDTKTGNEDEASEEGTASSSPEFSPDGTRLAFVLSGKDENYIEIREIATGSMEKSHVRGKISSIKWLDNSSIIALVQDYDPAEKKRKKEGDDGYFFEENHKFSCLWKYTPGRGMKRITSGFQIWDFGVRGNSAVAVASEFPYDWSWYQADISLVNLQTGERSTIYVPEKRQVSSPAFSTDGKAVYFIESLMSDNGVESGDILSLPVAGGNAENITGNSAMSFSSMQFSEKGELYALGNEMGTFRIVSLPGEKTVWSWQGAVMPVFSPKFTYGNGSFALALTSKDQPQEVALIVRDGKQSVITNGNRELSDLRKYDSKTVTWKSSDGLEIYGIFRKAAENSPLVVIVHGGPTSSSVETFMDYSTLLMGAGFSVFMPNYRGSTGKGRKYAELNRGDMGGMDLTDILSGVEHIVSTEAFDKERVYITGGSYGGFMSAWAITQTDRFRASVSLFGISDWISFHGVSSLAVWDSIHYDQDPYLFDRFQKFSAIRYLDNVKTPILLMHGIEDPYVPVGQYHQFFRALKDKGKEVRLLLFPREGHGFRERKHFQMYIDEMVKYFRDHS